MDKSGEEPLFKTSTGQEDSFYDTIETTSPEYDNAVNSSQAPPMDAAARAQQEQDMRADLAKLEEEIYTLRTVLSAKVNQAAEIKRQLGITPMTEFRHDMKQGLHNIKESNAVQKTNEKLTQITETIQTSDAYQKTNHAFKSFGAFASKKFGDMRNSNSFKSFEEKVGGAYTNVKTKVRGSKSENNFGEALADQEEPTTVENTADDGSLDKFIVDTPPQ